MRCSLRKASEISGYEYLNDSVPEFISRIAEIEHLLMGMDCGQSSRTAYRSQVRALHKWALVSGVVALPENGKKSLGYPEPTRAAQGNVYPGIKRTFDGLICFAAANKLPFERLQPRHVEEFIAIWNPESNSKVVAWRSFAGWWNSRVLEASKPELQVVVPTKKPVSYKISLQDLPPHLRFELEAARDRRLGRDHVNPTGRRPIQQSTADLEMEDILRYYGWLRGHGVDITGYARIADAVTQDGLIRFLEDRNEMSKLKYDDVDNGFGTTQKSLMERLTGFAAHALQNPELADMVKNLRVHHSRNFFQRREPRKDIGALDDYFRVALTLLNQANNNDGLTAIKCALLIRDAVIFVILGTFPYRRAVLTKLNIKTSLIPVETETGHFWRIRIPKNETKARKRWLNHDVPHMFTYLIDFYIERVRHHLLKGRTEQALLVRQGGRAMTSASIYNRVTKHTEHVLNVVHNPHQLRKSWVTEFLDYSDGDYMTPSAIIDSTPGVIEEYYEKRSTKRANARMDQGLDALSHNYLNGEQIKNQVSVENEDAA
jgi:hypothetical protein